MNSGIYKITNKVNNKCYIGSTKNLIKREKQHFNLLRNNKNHSKILQKAFNKYGEDNFKFEIIDTCLPKYLFILEQFYVDNIKPEYNICIINVSVPIGTNKKGYKYTKKHIELKRKEALIKLKDNINFGWKSKTIQKLDNNRNIIEEYKSLKEYAVSHNCSIANVSKSLKNKTKCKGFYIQYKSD